MKIKGINTYNRKYKISGLTNQITKKDEEKLKIEQRRNYIES